MRLACAEIWGGTGSTSESFHTPSFEISLFARAAEGGMGGDVHYLSLCDESYSRVAIADVMGHGPEVATTGEWMYQALAEQLDDDDDAAVLHRMNALAHRRGPEAMTTAVVIGLDVARRRLSYAYAGHHPLLFHRDDALGWRLLWAERTETPGELPLGASDRTNYRASGIELRPGDRMIALSDGVLEAPGSGDSIFGLRRLRRVLHAHRRDGPGQLTRAVVSALRAFTGDRLDHDDLTLIALEMR